MSVRGRAGVRSPGARRARRPPAGAAAPLSVSDSSYLRARLLVHEDAVGLGELGGADGRDLLELGPEVLDLVRVIAGDLPPERLLISSAETPGATLSSS